MFYCHSSAAAVGGRAEQTKQKNEKFSFFSQTAQVQRASEEEFRLRRTDFVIHRYVLRAAELLSRGIQQCVKCSYSQKSYTIVIKQLSAFLWVFQCFCFVWGFFAILNKARKFHAKNTIRYKTYNEVLWGNEQLTDIVCCDWEETFICLWEEHVCSHMSQQKESDSGISPGAGALEHSEGRKCGRPQRSEHLFSWPFHSLGGKWY